MLADVDVLQLVRCVALSKWHPVTVKLDAASSKTPLAALVGQEINSQDKLVQCPGHDGEYGLLPGDLEPN